jgi:predicted RNA-binding protein YlxR (DUF448 family)
MSAIKEPIRMCIICRGRYDQKTLIRFQITNGTLIEFSKVGRSSYICSTCLCLEEKKLVRAMNGRFKLNNKKNIEFGDFFSNRVREHNKETSKHD